MLLPASLLLLAPFSNAWALTQNTWYVDGGNPGAGTGTSLDPFITIQAAIDAPTTLSGDFIRVRDSVYREAVVVDGKQLRVIVGHAQNNVVIERVDTAGVPCLTVRNVASPGVLFAGFKFRDGPNATSSGRGIELDSAELEVSRCEFDSLMTAGSIGEGGAIWAGAGSSLVLTGCRLVDCGSNGVARGGAVAFEGDALIIDGSSFLGNECGSRGGAIWFDGTGIMSIRNSSFMRNLASDGAAVWMEVTAGDGIIRDTEFVLNGNGWTRLSGGVRGQGRIDNCSFRRNLGRENGGVSGAWDILGTEFDGNGGSNSDNWASAVHGQPRSTLTDCYIHDHVGASSSLPPSAVINADVVSCVFESNRTTVSDSMNVANGAGAISDCVAIDCVFTDNSIFASGCVNPNPDDCGRGGAAFRSELTGCILVGNSAAYGGAAAECQMTNCTLYGNSAVEEAGALWEGAMTNCVAFNNGPGPLSGGAAATWSSVEFGAPGTGNLASDPEFLLPGSGDLRLRGTSPCIQAGDPALPGPSGAPRDMGALPFDAEIPQAYCEPGPDFFGCTPVLRSIQPPTASVPFRFEAVGVSATTLTLSLLSMAADDLPYLNGQLCIGAPFTRGPIGVLATASSAPCDTRAEFTLTPADLQQMGFAPGDVLYTQVIYRAQGSPLGVAVAGALTAVIQP